jgi:hypothetical protein
VKYSSIELSLKKPHYSLYFNSYHRFFLKNKKKRELIWSLLDWSITVGAEAEVHSFSIGFLSDSDRYCRP